MNAIDSVPASNRGTAADSPIKVRAATASNWQTWPKVNARRNVPYVEGPDSTKEPGHAAVPQHT